MTERRLPPALAAVVVVSLLAGCQAQNHETPRSGASTLPRLRSLPGASLVGDWRLLSDPPGSREITIRYTAGNSCSPFLGIHEKLEGLKLRLEPAYRPSRPGAVCTAVAELTIGKIRLDHTYAPSQLLHPAVVTFGPQGP